MAVASIDHQINLCLQKLEDPSKMEESLLRLSLMGLTSEIMYRTGAGKVLSRYFSHPSLGSLARTIVEESNNTISSTSSDNEYFLPVSTDASFHRKRHNTDDTVTKWKRPRRSSTEGGTDEEKFSTRKRGFYGEKAHEENSIPLERTEEVQEEKNRKVDISIDEKLRLISQRIARRSMAMENGKRKTVSLDFIGGKGAYHPRNRSPIEKGTKISPPTYSNHAIGRSYQGAKDKQH